MDGPLFDPLPPHLLTPEEREALSPADRHAQQEDAIRRAAFLRNWPDLQGIGPASWPGRPVTLQPKHFRRGERPRCHQCRQFLAPGARVQLVDELPMSKQAFVAFYVHFACIDNYRRWKQAWADSGTTDDRWFREPPRLYPRRAARTGRPGRLPRRALGPQAEPGR